ncbi:flagellar filament capping protein FliD [Priestia sp. BR_2]
MTIKISGMASGMDIDKIVSDLMKAEKLPSQKLHQQKQTAIWTRDQYREVNMMLSKLTNAVDKLRFATNFSKLSANSSNSSVVEATMKTGAKESSYSIQVNQLATSATVIGSEITVPTFPSGTVTLSDGTNSKPVTLDGKTPQNVVDEINKLGLGIRASFDAVNNRISLVSSTVGGKSEITLGGNVGQLGLTAGTTNGDNAEVLVNGKTVSIANNSLELDGVSLKLKGVSTGPVTVGVSKETTSVKNQIMEFVNLYNTTIDSLREKSSESVFRTFKPLTDEEKESMTDKQIELWESKAKSGLLRNESILEETMNTLRNNLSKELTTSGVFNSLSDIGISFKSFMDGGIKELGKLKVDEAKLEQAINDHPDDVINLFTQAPTADKSKPSERLAQTGFADRIYEALKTQSSKIIKKIGSGTNSELVDNSYYGNLIRDLNSKIKTTEDRLEKVEDRYYKQFVAMEKAIQKLNNQGSWLSQQLG